MRAALGGYYGTPLRTVSLALVIGCPVIFVGGLVLAIYDGQVHGSQTQAAHGWWLVVPLCLPVFIVAMILRFVVESLASPARVAAERRWAKSLPVGLDDTYFEVLAAEPRMTTSSKESSGSSIPRRAALPTTPTWSGWRAAPSGDTGVSVGSDGGATSAILRNDRIVAYVHRFVDEVLLPLHESSPIARVRFHRS